MNDEIISQHEALGTIRNFGYLNEFSTPVEGWFEASQTPLEGGELNPRIAGRTADTLIHGGKLVKVSNREESNLRVTCYRLA